MPLRATWLPCEVHSTVMALIAGSPQSLVFHGGGDAGVVEQLSAAPAPPWSRPGLDLVGAVMAAPAWSAPALIWSPVLLNSWLCWRRSRSTFYRLTWNCGLSLASGLPGRRCQGCCSGQRDRHDSQTGRRQDRGQYREESAAFRLKGLSFFEGKPLGGTEDKKGGGDRSVGQGRLLSGRGRSAASRYCVSRGSPKPEGWQMQRLCQNDRLGPSRPRLGRPRLAGAHCAPSLGPVAPSRGRVAPRLGGVVPSLGPDLSRLGETCPLGGWTRPGGGSPGPREGATGPGGRTRPC